jgi:hypothetical protein
VVFSVFGHITAQRGVKIIEQEIKAMANYFELTDKFAVLIEKVGEIGKALQGEGEVRESIQNLAETCQSWLDEI